MDIKEDIKSQLTSRGSKHYLNGVLHGIDDKDKLINFLHRYTIFNGDFAGGVSNLAGAFHIRGDLFSQSHEPISSCSDVSAQIASHIFFAAEDEYACRYNKERVTHRCLGQFL